MLNALDALYRAILFILLPPSVEFGRPTFVLAFPASPPTVNVLTFLVKSMASPRKLKSENNGMRRKNTTTSTDRPTTTKPVSDEDCGGCVQNAFCHDNVCKCQYTGFVLQRGEPCVAVPPPSRKPNVDKHNGIDNYNLRRIVWPSTTADPSRINNPLDVNRTDMNTNGSIVISAYNSTTTPNNVLTTPFTTVILAIALSSATFIFLVLAIACWLRRRHLAQRGVHSDNIFCFWQRPKLCLGLQALGKTSVLDNQQFTANPNYYTTPPEMALLKSLLHLEISGDKLVFLDVIGEGCFGKVFKGVFHKNENEVSDVAVKVLKENSSNELQVDFLREVEIMSSFDHENILALLGVVLIENGCIPWMVFEYMEYGDLAEVLRENSPYFWNMDNISCKITKADLTQLAIQIASGMTYLSSQHFVHRDLATRNCLVGKQLIVKIADFGMSRDIYTCDYYKIGGSRLLPVRWMSPESVMYGKFTLESDIWSFGVVLWEIFAYGKQPYFGHSNEEVVKLIRQGILLTPPEECPHHICQLMKMCWKTNPYDRVKFPDIHDMLMHKVSIDDRVLTQQYISQDNGSIITGHQICPTVGNNGISTDVVDHQNYLVPRSANGE